VPPSWKPVLLHKGVKGPLAAGNVAQKITLFFFILSFNFLTLDNAKRCKCNRYTKKGKLSDKEKTIRPGSQL
jgi:hypothetical protein